MLIEPDTFKLPVKLISPPTTIPPVVFNDNPDDVLMNNVPDIVSPDLFTLLLAVAKAALAFAKEALA